MKLRVLSLIKGNDSLKSYQEMSVAVLMVDDFNHEAVLIEKILGKNYQPRN